MNVRFLASGDTALVVEFGDRVDRELSERVLRLSGQVRASNVPGVIETLPTYRSLMVRYDPRVTDSMRLTASIDGLLHEARAAPKPTTRWRIPACYEASHAPDLEDVARRTGLHIDDIVGIHTGTSFHVYMIGFVPGFPYMGDLPDSLCLPRREDPRVKVPAGSIAIAANMTAVYPVESPGGWHLIGATPVRLFDVRASRPALLSPGDSVRFEPITAAEFDRIREAGASGTYRVPFEVCSP